MKKYINGLLYNTNTAEYLDERESAITQDLMYIREALYRKRSGEYFLAGEGGAMTRYSKPTEYRDGRTGGSGIIPLSVDEAQAWAETYLTTDRYNKIFGEPTEDDGEITISLRLPIRTTQLIKRRAAEQSTTQRAIIEAALDLYFKDRKK